MAIPLSLQNSLREGRVVPFVGAGVSMAVVDKQGERLFPTWRDLLLSASNRLDYEQKPRDATLVRAFLDVDEPDFLEAAKRARNRLGAAWYDLLKQQLEVPRNAVNEVSLDLARAVWALRSQLIITTNYDEVLHWSCPHASDLQIWDIQAPAEQIQWIQGRLTRPTLWHLHGSINNAANLILTRDAYGLLYPDKSQTTEPTYRAALETLRTQIASKTILFVGFSLDDEYVGMQLKGIDEVFKGAVGPHYAIIRKAEEHRVRQLKLPVEILTVAEFGDPLIDLLGEIAKNIPETASPAPVTISRNAADYGTHHSIFFVPFRQKGDQVVGQKDALAAVRKQLTEGKRTAIGQTAAFQGLGGLGKTQLAVEYAYCYRDKYPNGVIWINADQDIDAQLIDIAQKGRWVPPAAEHKYKLEVAQERIRSYSNCLIIFDNLDDSEAIAAYLPEPEATPHILVTSRIDHVDFFPVPLSLLSEELSLELLIQEAGREPENEAEELAAKEIARNLGGLPLALELAGAYLSHRSDVAYRTYNELLLKDLRSALPQNLSSFTKHEADLYHTLKLSEGLFREEPLLCEILDLLTWSGSASMSYALISTLVERPNSVLVGALALGVSLRLLQKSATNEGYLVHRLVGEVRRGEFPLVDRADLTSLISKRLGDWFQERSTDFSFLPTLEAEIDHLEAWQRNAAELGLPDASRLEWLRSYPALHRGRYAEAEAYLTQARKMLDGPGQTNRELEANVLNDLSGIAYEFEDFRSTVKFASEGLVIRRALFGQTHHDIARSLANLANGYIGQKDFPSGLKYSMEALNMLEELFGKRHHDMASVLANIGTCYGRQGELEKALDYSNRALAMQREVLKLPHPDVALSLNNIANCYANGGHFQEALDYLGQAFAMNVELLGERHPSTIKVGYNIAVFLAKSGKRSQAYDFVEKLLTQVSGHSPLQDRLQRLEAELLSKALRKGFRQPPKHGKVKRKKNR